MNTDVRAVSLLNILSLISFNPSARWTSVKFLQFPNAEDPNETTVLGTVTDLNAQLENAELPIMTVSEGISMSKR